MYICFGWVWVLCVRIVHCGLCGLIKFKLHASHGFSLSDFGVGVALLPPVAFTRVTIAIWRTMDHKSQPSASVQCNVKLSTTAHGSERLMESAARHLRLCSNLLHACCGPASDASVLTILIVPRSRKQPVSPRWHCWCLGLFVETAFFWVES